MNLIPQVGNQISRVGYRQHRLEEDSLINYSQAQSKNELPAIPTIDSLSHNAQNDRRQKKLFIGGISLNVDIAELEWMLAEEIRALGTLSISMVKKTKNNTYSGYGYIASTQPEDLPALLRLGTFKFRDSWIGIKPYLTRKADIKQLKTDKDQRKIHIKGVTARVSEVDLEQYFGQFGPISHIQINKSQSTGSYKGFAFLEFQYVDSVIAVVSQEVHCVRGVTLHCEKSKTKQVDIDVNDDEAGWPNSNSCGSRSGSHGGSPHLSAATLARVGDNHANSSNLVYRRRTLLKFSPPTIARV